MTIMEIMEGQEKLITDSIQKTKSSINLDDTQPKEIESKLNNE